MVAAGQKRNLMAASIPYEQNMGPSVLGQREQWNQVILGCATSGRTSISRRTASPSKRAW